AQPVLGAQFAIPGNMALGLTVKKGFILSQNLDISSETRTSTLSNEAKDQLAQSGATTAAIAENIVDKADGKVKKPVGDWPTEMRLGWAWFASPVFMWSIDITHYSAVNNAEKFKANGDKPKYNRNA